MCHDPKTDSDDTYRDSALINNLLTQINKGKTKSTIT